jgi:hypothetical protein
VEGIFDWPLLILADDASIAKTSARFLWSVFTRFEPAADIYAAGIEFGAITSAIVVPLSLTPG